MAIFLNESRPNWELHYSRPSEPIRSVRGEESGGYVFHMVRESAICYDSQVEECMHSENSHLPFCHFVFYSATMSSRPADIIFKVLHFQKGKHKYLFYVFAFTLPSTMQKSDMSHCWWISWYSYYSIIQFPLKKWTICTFLFLTYTPCNPIKWCSAQPKWADWQLTWPIIRAGRSRYKRSGNFCGQL